MSVWLVWPEGSHTLQLRFPPGCTGSPRPGGSALPPHLSSRLGVSDLATPPPHTLGRGGGRRERGSSAGKCGLERLIWRGRKKRNRIYFNERIRGLKQTCGSSCACFTNDLDRKQAADSESGGSTHSIQQRILACLELHPCPPCVITETTVGGGGTCFI